MKGSVGEVDAEAELEAARIERVVGEGEVVLAGPSLIDMATEHVEAAFVELGRGVCVAERIVADFRLVLGVESHRGRLIVESVESGVVVAVDAYLHLKHSECPEIKKHIGVNGQSREGDYLLSG